MTTLLVQELLTGEVLEHEFDLESDVRYPIAAFYPYLYVHNSPDGDFLFELIKAGNVVYSHSFTSVAIKASIQTLNDYIRIFYPIIPSNPCHLDKGRYIARLSSENYEFSYGSFIGWIQQHENLNNEMGYTPLFDTENPLALKLKQYREGITI